MDSQPERPRHPLDIPPEQRNQPSRQENFTSLPTMTAPVRQKPEEGQYIHLPYSRPIFTYSILIINALVFLADQFLLQRRLSELGVLYKPAVQSGEVWRLLTAIFLHANSEHIIANSLGLWIIGTQVENAYGHIRFLLLYFLTGLAGSAAGLLFYPESAGLGASGAIEGLVGALLMLILLNRHIFRNPIGIVLRILFILMLNLAAAMSISFNLPMEESVANIGYWAHLGGALLGILLGWRIAPRYQLIITPSGRPEKIVDASSFEIIWIWAALSLVVLIGIISAALWLP